MKKFHSEIINQAELIAALMDENVVLYVLYLWKGHLFRFENGKITSADSADIKFYEGREKDVKKIS